MAIKLINIGFGNIVSANRLIAIVDATYGRRTRAVVIMDSDHVILSAVQPETVAHRIVSKDNDEQDD